MEAVTLLRRILAADEAGQGVAFSEAMNDAKRYLDSLEPCETCNDDPEVCASVPSLRHCEKATRKE